MFSSSEIRIWSCAGVHILICGRTRGSCQAVVEPIKWKAGTLTLRLESKQLTKANPRVSWPAVSTPCAAEADEVSRSGGGLRRMWRSLASVANWPRTKFSLVVDGWTCEPNNAHRKNTAKGTEGQFPKSCILCAILAAMDAMYRLKDRLQRVRKKWPRLVKRPERQAKIAKIRAGPETLRPALRRRSSAAERLAY